MKRVKTLLLAACIGLALLVPVGLVRADPPVSPPTNPPVTPNPPELTDFATFIKSDNAGALYNFMVAAGYTMAVVGIVYAGVLYLSAFGSEERPGLAKKAIIAVVTGLTIIVLARVIVDSIVPDNQSSSIVNTGLN